MKKVKLFFAVSVASAVLSMTSFAGEWKQDNTGWWYQNDDGSYPVNSWKEIDGNSIILAMTAICCTILRHQMAKM